MIAYVMIIEEPHIDVAVRLYADRDRAVAAAEGYAAAQLDGTGTELHRVDGTGDEIYLTWADDYAVRVVARAVIA